MGTGTILPGELTATVTEHRALWLGVLTVNATGYTRPRRKCGRGRAPIPVVPHAVADRHREGPVGPRHAQVEGHEQRGRAGGGGRPAAGLHRGATRVSPWQPPAAAASAAARTKSRRPGPASYGALGRMIAPQPRRGGYRPRPWGTNVKLPFLKPARPPPFSRRGLAPGQAHEATLELCKSKSLACQSVANEAHPEMNFANGNWKHGTKVAELAKVITEGVPPPWSRCGEQRQRRRDRRPPATSAPSTS